MFSSHVCQFDATFDMSHTQNIGRMIKTHFPQSQVEHSFVPDSYLSFTVWFTGPNIIKYEFNIVFFCFFNAKQLEILFSVHFSRCLFFCVCSSLRFLLKKECSTMQMSYIAPTMLTQFPLFRALPRLIRISDMSIFIVRGNTHAAMYHISHLLLHSQVICLKSKIYLHTLVYLFGLIS